MNNIIMFFDVSKMFIKGHESTIYLRGEFLMKLGTLMYIYI